MTNSKQPSDANAGPRVVRLRPRRKPGRSPPFDDPPLDDLARYQRPAGDEDDYRRRMIANALAFAFTAMLVVAGVWLADRIAAMRNDQDCVLSGRRGCTAVEVPATDR